MVGGVVGAAFGQVEGILLAEVVEAIDNKINENKIKDEQTKEDTKNSQFNVLQRLVFKFDKNLLFKEDYSSKTEQKKTEKTDSKSQFYLDTKKEEINDEDYEIYLLEDANEVLAEAGLNVSSRKSIESFSADQLPSEMNIFFRYSDLLEKDKS